METYWISWRLFGDIVRSDILETSANENIFFLLIKSILYSTWLIISYMSPTTQNHILMLFEEEQF